MIRLDSTTAVTGYSIRRGAGPMPEPVAGEIRFQSIASRRPRDINILSRRRHVIPSPTNP
jgi:hypothetical protein